MHLMETHKSLRMGGACAIIQMVITRKQTWEKVNELIENKNLLKHCLAVEAVMLSYADYFKIPKSEKEKWGLAGLVHDADWEKYPKKHPQIILNWLAEQLADEDLINAIASHGFNFNVEAKTLMAKTLRAVDELTGLIVAVALVRKSKKLSDVTVDSVLKKWNSKSFASGVKRKDIERGASEIGINLKEHIKMGLTAMQKISNQLGL